jgi:hypothetical protein
MCVYIFNNKTLPGEEPLMRLYRVRNLVVQRDLDIRLVVGQAPDLQVLLERRKRHVGLGRVP